MDIGDCEDQAQCESEAEKSEAVPQRDHLGAEALTQPVANVATGNEIRRCRPPPADTSLCY